MNKKRYLKKSHMTVIIFFMMLCAWFSAHFFRLDVYRFLSIQPEIYFAMKGAKYDFPDSSRYFNSMLKRYRFYNFSFYNI